MKDKKQFKWIAVEDALPTRGVEEHVVMVAGHEDGRRYYYWASVYPYGRKATDEVFAVPGWSQMNVTHWAEIPQL